MLLNLIGQEKLENDKQVQTFILRNGKEYAIESQFDRIYQSKIIPGKYLDFVIYKLASYSTVRKSKTSKLPKAQITTNEIAENKKLKELEANLKAREEIIGQMEATINNQKDQIEKLQRSIS